MFDSLPLAILRFGNRIPAGGSLHLRSILDTLIRFWSRRRAYRLNLHTALGISSVRIKPGCVEVSLAGILQIWAQ